MVPRKLVERSIGMLPLLLIPVILGPILVLAALLVASDTYRSSAGIWVSNPRIGDTEASLGSENTLATPAERQAQALRELLSTRAFVEGVAVEAGVLPPRPDRITRNEERERLQVVARVREAIDVRAPGVNLLSISVEASTAERAEGLNRGVVTLYEQRFSDEITNRAETARQYYTQQLQVAERELEQRREAAQAYLAANPQAAEPGAVDIQYEALADQLRTQREVVAGLHGSLQAAEMQALTSSEGTVAFFRVEDRPNFPTSPVPIGLTRLGGYPAAGMVLGLMISAAYLYVAYRSDHTIRSGEDLAGTGLLVLGVMPELSETPRRAWSFHLRWDLPWTEAWKEAWKRPWKQPPEDGFARQAALQAAGISPSEEGHA